MTWCLWDTRINPESAIHDPEFFNAGSRTGPSNLQTLQKIAGEPALQGVKAEDTLNLEALLGDKNFDETEADVGTCALRL